MLCALVFYINIFKYRQLGSLIEHRFDGSLFDIACFNTMRDTHPPAILIICTVI